MIFDEKSATDAQETTVRPKQVIYNSMPIFIQNISENICFMLKNKMWGIV